MDTHADDKDNAPLSSKFPKLKSGVRVPTVQVTYGDEGE